MRKILFLFMALSFIFGCARDKSAAFPKGFFLTNENGDTIKKVIKTNIDGSFDQDAAEDTLKSDFRPTCFVSYTSSAKSNRREAYEANDFKALQITPTLLQLKEGTGRQFFSLDTDFVGSYIAQASVTGSYKYMLEYQLLSTNPQYKMNYVVKPDDLMEYQAVYSERGRKFIFLFNSMILAPDSLMIHELRKVEAKVDFPVYFKTDGGVFLDVKTTLGHRFVLRVYSMPEFVRSLVNGKSQMFELADKTKPVTYTQGTTSKPVYITPAALIFEYAGNKYRVSDDYLDHLTAENVMFDNPIPAGKKILKIRSYDELQKGLVPITTSSFIEKTKK